MTKAITFDFWDTLYPAFGSDGGKTPAELRALTLQEFLKQIGKEFSIEQTRAAYDHAEARLFEHWRTDLRYCGPDQAIEDMAVHLKVRLSSTERKQLVERFRFTSKVGRIIPFDGVAELLARLSAKYRLGIVSDTWLSPGVMLREVMERDGLLRFFSATVFSDETGFLKPHVRQFRLAIEALGARPEDAVHVGDSEKRDVAGAKQLGMKTVLLAWDSEPTGTEADAVVTDITHLAVAIQRLAGS